jgi:hypothetical protein
MAFIPFGYYKSPAVAWTPADLPSLYDYWEADSGTTGTTNVSQWTGKENSYNFTYPVNTNGPELITANSGFNNQDILRFDRSNTEGLYFTLTDGNGIGTSTQVNYSIYADPEAITSGNWRMFWGLSRTSTGDGNFAESIGGSNSSAFKWYTYDGGGKTTTLGQSTTPKQLMTMVCDYANNQVKLFFGTSEDSASPISEPNLGNRNGAQVFSLALYNPESSGGELPGSMDLGGVAIWTGDDDFSTNLSNLETYFQDKYGS